MERFTISLDDKLAHEFDHWIAGRGYANRSEAIRDLFRAELERTRQATHQSVHCVACLSYVYNHHERDLAERLTGLHHAQHELTIASMHAHLDHDHCLETVILKGETAAVQRFADAVCAERGVHHGKVNLISVDVHGPGDGPGDHGHHEVEHDASRPHLHLKPAS
jgi:CopG family nickel-responsive transcriptional regulator